MKTLKETVIAVLKRLEADSGRWASVESIYRSIPGGKKESVRRTLNSLANEDEISKTKRGRSFYYATNLILDGVNTLIEQAAPKPAPKADKGKPEAGKVYALTGTGPCVAAGNTWAESVVEEPKPTVHPYAPQAPAPKPTPAVENAVVNQDATPKTIGSIINKAAAKAGIETPKSPLHDQIVAMDDDEAEKLKEAIATKLKEVMLVYAALDAREERIAEAAGKKSSLPEKADVKEAVKSYARSLEEMIQTDHAKNFPSLKPETITVEWGRRYAKIIRRGTQNCVHSFVDLKGGKVEGIEGKVGDIYKAASWAKVAKHARGNVFTDDNGLSGVGVYGANYLS